MRRKYKDEINKWVDIAGWNAVDATHNLEQFLLMQAERDELKLKVLELSTEVERLSRELARG
jgi:hypothetical protein